MQIKHVKIFFQRKRMFQHIFFTTIDHNCQQIGIATKMRKEEIPKES
jgi:hypothetical protein